MHGKKIVSEKCEITVNRKIKDTEGTYILRIKNGFIASNFKPGQFVMLKINEGGLNPLLSRPFSILNRFGDSEFEVLYRVFGKGTEMLSRIEEGGFLEVTGPLGNGFNLDMEGGSGSAVSGSSRGSESPAAEQAVDVVEQPENRKMILIAGGIGIAPLYSIPLYSPSSSELQGGNFETGRGEGRQSACKTILYYGARKAEELYFRHSIHSRFDEVYFATDDGSFGFKGNIVDMLYENIGGYADADFYACGPKPMLNALISRFSASGLSGRLQASLEESFGCGIGVCLGCVIKTKTNTGFEYKRVCKDGPVFYADDILIPEKEETSGISLISGAKSADKNAEPDLSVKLGNLFLDYPVMPASGTFGYGEEFFEIIDYDYFGALVTKGISLKPSKGNEMPRICETSCGMINSIGLQNVGFEKFRDEKMPFLRNFKKPVIVNFFGSSIDEYAELAEKLVNIGGIGALEANISCPNIKEGGRSFGSDPEVVYELVSSVKEKIGGGPPLIVKLTPMVSDISLIAEVCEKAGADIISLINTIPAAAIDIKTKKFKLNRGYGGLSGAAVKPVALKLVGDVYNAVRIPVIGMGGISSWEDAAEFFLAGATAVAVGTYAFVNPKIITEITAGLKNYLAENGFDSIYRIIGSVHNNK